MPKSSWPTPPIPIEWPEETKNFFLEWFHHSYGAGDDITGILDGDNIIGTFGLSSSVDETITGDWTFSGSTSGINHTELDNIGTNTHAQIDTHIADTANPHSVTLAQVVGDSDDISEGSTNLYYTQARQDDIEAFAFAMGT